MEVKNMETNPIIEGMLKRKSIRRYTDEMPSDEVIETIVRAGQQAPFAYQMYSVLLTRKGVIIYDAPLLFTICVDVHKFELIMKRRNWELVMNNLMLLVLAFQDTALMAQNMVMAAESLGLGSCFLGAAPYYADETAGKYGLPERVFPMVGLVMGYPAEDPPPRPRYPLEYTFFEDAYPELDDEMITRAMKTMDEGYLSQDYYTRLKAKIKLEGEREETYTYEDYSWTEHISRKVGQWDPEPDELLDQFSGRGFDLRW
jgi:nitroreductase